MPGGLMMNLSARQEMMIATACTVLALAYAWPDLLVWLGAN